ncbi:hypothetical protein ABW20_dc0106210 [Dactylellina cionopaga]|nr:hypothetical protein ABW20_dc0106210 [Dactylellina cionopaga]
MLTYNTVIKRFALTFFILFFADTGLSQSNTNGNCGNFNSLANCNIFGLPTPGTTAYFAPDDTDPVALYARGGSCSAGTKGLVELCNTDDDDNGYNDTNDYNDDYEHEHEHSYRPPDYGH